jgi:hypothetical protein
VAEVEVCINVRFALLQFLLKFGVAEIKHSCEVTLEEVVE